MKYNRFTGVPILSNKEIEQIAYDFLSEYNDYSLRMPCKAPVTELLDYLQREYSVEIGTGNLGEEDNKKVLARIIFSKNMIIFDKEIMTKPEMEPLFLFTGAHEIGHWVLHRHREIKFKESEKVTEQLIDFNENFKQVYDFGKDYEQIDNFIKKFLEFPGKRRLLTPRDWIEHHAHYFAASLLMPREPFVGALVEIQKKLGITRRFGKIYLDKHRYSQLDHNKIVSHLQEIFGVSKKAIAIRLKKLKCYEEAK